MSVRMLAAVAVLVSAAVHFDLWPDVRDNHVIGPAFLLNAVGGVVIAALLVFWKHWAPPLLALGFGISTIGAFTISATVGMFGVHEHWSGFAVWLALVSEVVAIAAGSVAALREHAARSGSQADPVHATSEPSTRRRSP
jgi:hypothetical protein